MLHFVLCDDNLNILDKEKQPVMSKKLKPTVFESSKIKIELQEGYDKNLE